jgi:hypothetical protein
MVLPPGRAVTDAKHYADTQTASLSQLVLAGEALGAAG